MDPICVVTAVHPDATRTRCVLQKGNAVNPIARIENADQMVARAVALPVAWKMRLARMGNV